MNKPKTPEWFIDIIRGAHGFAIDQQDDGEDHAENFIEEMWRRISKPENIAKIDSVNALVEAAKLFIWENEPFLEQGDVFEMNEALKPFEGINE